MASSSSEPTSTSKDFVPAVYNGFIDAIGNTPLIFLKNASERTGCQIYGKAEFLNPGGSVKDRAAKFLVEGLEVRVRLIKNQSKSDLRSDLVRCFVFCLWSLCMLSLSHTRARAVYSSFMFL